MIANLSRAPEIAQLVIAQDGDVVGDSAGDGLVVSPAPPVPELHAPRRATNPSIKAKLTTFVFITPLSPISARATICSLITIPHLLTFLTKVEFVVRFCCLFKTFEGKHKQAF